MSADEKLKYVVSLLRGDAQPCPDCGEAMLVPLHPRRKSKHGDIKLEVSSVWQNRPHG
jgi:hypothetical protein